MSKITKIVRIALIASMLASGQANGKSASQTAKDYFNLLQEKNYSAAVSYYDPVALAEFRQMMSFGNEIPADERQAFFQAFFGSAATGESVAKLSNPEFFASFLHAVLNADRPGWGVNFGVLEILGEVMEGKDIAHVVIRNAYSVAETQVESVEVISFKKIGEQWKVQLSGKLESIAATLRWKFTHQQ